MYRRIGPQLEVLLVHPGGPYWRRKDEGAWSIPKGEIDAGEDAGDAARREFLARSVSVAASVSMHSPSTATWTSRPLQATPSK
jgi:predicted NUDIX family NTP pyrophosphohydrolase